ncbi:NAD(P)-binding domain-containing protein [Massilia sp. B-10]|nr:NAD(P)-binding domain-containing protein [Massilia sp. B-10]
MIGCGAMGGAIARRLLGLGYPLNVYNRSPGKTRSLARAGAIVHATPLKAARASDVIISVVTDAAAVRDVLFRCQAACCVCRTARAW